MDDEEVVEDEELPEGLDSIVPTSALSLRRRGDGIRVLSIAFTEIVSVITRG